MAEIIISKFESKDPRIEVEATREGIKVQINYSTLNFKSVSEAVTALGTAMGFVAQAATGYNQKVKQAQQDGSSADIGLDLADIPF